MIKKAVFSFMLFLTVMTAGAVPVGHVGGISDDDGDDYLATYSGIAMEVVTTYVNGQPQQGLTTRVVTGSNMAICTYYLHLRAGRGGYVVSPCKKN